jgi:phage I-like protein
MTEALKDYSAEAREKLAKESKALPDGSFPIVDVADLRNAIQAAGRASNPGAAKAHIKKRAAALGQSGLIPEGWAQEEGLDYVVAFAVAGADESGISEPFEVLRVGEFKRGERTVPVSEADLDQAVANFNRWKALGQEIPVDYDHAFNEGREAPAAGWFTSLIRKGQSLWAQVRWTEQAREQIASRAYRFFSPEFTAQFRSESGQEEGFTILAGALTNRPFLRGMTPVALSQEVEREMLAWFAAKLVAEEPPSRADTRPDVTEKTDTDTQPETFKVEIDGAEKEFKAADIVALSAKAAEADAASEKATEAEKAAKEKAAEAAASKGQVEALSTRIDAAEKRESDRDFAEIFKQAQRDGRLDAKDETEKTWRETFDALGAEKTKALVEQVPAETIPLSSQGRSGSGEQEAAPKGMHAESFKLNQRVEAFMAEHPDKSFEDALAHVQAEIQKAAA